MEIGNCFGRKSNAKGGKVEWQQNKKWKWEVGTGRGRSKKDLEGVF